MTEYTIDQITELLAQKGFDQLVGAVETSTVEFKEQPYDLKLPRSKHNMAKDVSALANSKGGAIVLGYSTKRAAGRATDEVEKARPFSRLLFDEKQWRDVLDELIFPPIDGIEFSWCASGANKGHLLMLVPKQSRSAQPFLVVLSRFSGNVTRDVVV